jgi:hypothetical protein
MGFGLMVALVAFATLLLVSAYELVDRRDHWFCRAHDPEGVERFR